MSTILWIEDEAHKIGGLVRPLEKIGHNIIIATDKAGAFDALSKARYDLIILDVIIPSGSATDKFEPYEGINLLKALRVDMQIKTPVLVLSVVNDVTALDEIRKLGVAKILRKGALLPSELLGEVQDIL